MKKHSKTLIVLFCLTMLLVSANVSAAVTFAPAPYQDPVNGRNSYTYNPAPGHPTSAEQSTFIADVKVYAMAAQQQWGVPASVIIGMAAVESGYGFTQIAYFANNLFGMKVWGAQANSWQLKGQPDENGGTDKILVDYGYDRKIFDETTRPDNWYKAFYSRQDAVNYLAGTLLQNSRYKPALTSYQYRITSGWSLRDAARQYCYDIAQAGYNHLGGAYYQNKIGTVMDAWNLYQYDKPVQTSTTTPTTTTKKNKK